MNSDESANPPTARPDLIEYFLDGSFRKDLLTNSVVRGDSIQVEYNVFNSGFAQSGTFDVDFYLSTNTTISTFDHLIGTRNHSLGAWAYTNPTATLTVPLSVPAGTYYVGWTASGGVTEYSVDNNSAVIGSETLEVTDQRSLTVSSPNGGETWSSGQTEAINWTSTSAGSTVTIEISRNSGSTWSTITASTENDGAYDWVVEDPTSEDCRVRVTSIAYPSVADSSDGDFTIAESCAWNPDEVFWAQIVDGSMSVTACNSITAGGGFVVGDGGVVTFTAGVSIVLENSFSVESGGTFTAVIDSSLAP